MVIMSMRTKKIFRLSLDGVFCVFSFCDLPLLTSTFCIDFREI